MTKRTRWVLAYDGDCGSCHRLSQRVERACGGRLETLPLGSETVREWRTQALGASAGSAPPAPTLFRVEGQAVRAWPGRAMVVPLVRHLGLRSSIAVTHALGSLRDEIAADAPEPAGLVSRKRFLQFGAGAAIASALVVRGAVPAYAATPVRTWVEKNAHRLPTMYDAIARYPHDYRAAILAKHSPARRSALWTEHVDRFRQAHQDLTAAQREVVDEVRAVVARPARFAAEPSESTRAADEALKARSERAFGKPETKALLATFGPAGHAVAEDGVTPHVVICSCSNASDFCFPAICFRTSSCVYQSGGCGAFYTYPCDGQC